MNLSFIPNEEDDILNTTIRDSDTGSVVYIVETPQYVGGTLSTSVTRQNRTDGSIRFVFRILWKGGKGSLGDTNVILDNRTSQEVPAREILENATGSTTYGSVRINDVEYRWKSKGTGSKVVLVTKDNTTVVQSHSRKRSSLFRKPRDMVLEISEDLTDASDIILLTFILVWKERQKERAKPMGGFTYCLPVAVLPPLPGDD